MAEFKLSYTATEIDEKLGKVSKLTEDTENLFTNVGSLQTDVDVLNSDVGVLQTDVQTKAEVVTLTTAEYEELENAGTTNANALYMITDGDEEVIRSDWNQTNSSAPDFVKNRTHYEIPEVTTVLQLEEYNGNEWLVHYNWESNKPYTLRIDGVVYSFDSMTQGDYHGASGQHIWYLGEKANVHGTNVQVSEWVDYPFSIHGIIISTNPDFSIQFEDGTPNHTVEVIEAEGEIHYLDPKYIKDMYYDNGTTVTELIPSQTISGFALMEDPIYGVENPFELTLAESATYIVNWDGAEYETVCKSHPVGCLYIGNENYVLMQSGGDFPFAVLSFRGNVFVATESSEESHNINITGIKHDLKQIDKKYLPIMEDKVIFSNDAVVNDNVYFNEKKLVGEYFVIFDGVKETVTFVNDYDYSFAEGSNFYIETWNAEGSEDGLYIECDDGEHSLIIEEINSVIKEEYLPIRQSDWNASDGEIGYIKNRTHYEFQPGWTQINLINDNWNSRATCKLYSTPIEWSKDNSYQVRVDGVEYEFDGMTLYTNLNIFGSNNLYYIGAEYVPYNPNIDFSQYSFCFVTLDFEHIYAVFEDDTLNHTVEFFDSNIVVKQIDQKYIPNSDWNASEGETGYIKNKPNVVTEDSVILKSEQTLTDDELTQVRKNLKFIGKDVEGQTFTINGENIVASPNAEIFGDYENNKCTGQWSIVEGSANIATGRACHVEGAQNQALSDGCHVEGVNCVASGFWSHAEGEYTRVTSYASHAEGSYTKMPDGSTRYGTASGYASHVEGGGCYAQGSCSHSEGLATTTKGNYSHSEGRYTIASSPAQHVEGIANIEDTNSTYIHIAGNGDFGAPSNAHTLDWDGNAWFAGDVYVGSASGKNKDEGSVKLQKSITGTPGQFVVIGDDGNVTTKTIGIAEEASF